LTHRGQAGERGNTADFRGFRPAREHFCRFRPLFTVPAKLFEPLGGLWSWGATDFCVNQ
jgi:hypothetical protein